MDPRWSSWNTAPLISPSLLTPTLKQTQSTQAAAALCKRAVDSLLPCFVLHASSAFLKIINQRPTKLTLSLYPEKSHPGTLCSNICSHAISSGSGGCQVGWQPKARKRKAGWVNGRPYLQESGLGRDTDFALVSVPGCREKASPLSVMLCGTPLSLGRSVYLETRERWSLLKTMCFLSVSNKEQLIHHVSPFLPWFLGSSTLNWVFDSARLAFKTFEEF